MKRNSLFPVMNTLFDDIFTRDLWNSNSLSATNTSIPAVNIRETNEAFIVEVAAPGMSKDDFSVELDGNLLTISSEKKETNEQKEGERYTRREFSYQSFERSFQLHKDVVDADRIEAKYDNGVLHLTIPKKEEVKQKSRSIQIN
ncbi:MAG TPA: Hsp20/alpha crystallin family protein [Flavisolibacter sp.]|nr:Hsp20/alpha crystallin family protein [Flavisolibacter sp.]